jgi:trimeric autotransporter adhesin
MRTIHHTLVLVIALAAVSCRSSATTTQPSGQPTLSAFSFSSTSLGIGASAQGTVSLTASAPATMNITLSSSNPSIVSVPATLAIASGASTATFTATAAAAGTATVTAAFNGSSQSSQIVVTGSLAIASVTASVSTLVGGTNAQASVTLTGAAPPGGATVALSAEDPASTPASVFVPAGATSVPFAITTRVVATAVSSHIVGTYGGATVSMALSITPPTAATAHFGVTGTSMTDTCMLTNGGTALDCTFNGSTSTSPGTIIAWDWTYGVSMTALRSQTTTTAVFAQPAFSCSMLPPPPLPAGTTYLTLLVTLVVHDDRGNVSAEAVDNGVRLLPQGACGY